MECTVDIIDHPHLDSPPFTFQLTVPPQGSPFGCEISTNNTYHNLPFISYFTPGTSLAMSLLLHGHPNTSFWILSINGQEFITAQATSKYLCSLQQPIGSSFVLCIMARRIASNRTSFEGNRVLFNQIRLTTVSPTPTDTPAPPSVIVPMGLKVISSPIRPDTPAHFGQTINMPHSADWKAALFENYGKMLTTGTFSAPMLRTEVPSDKTVLRS